MIGPLQPGGAAISAQMLSSCRFPNSRYSLEGKVQPIILLDTTNIGPTLAHFSFQHSFPLDL